jgi:hypothetical protein
MLEIRCQILDPGFYVFDWNDLWAWYFELCTLNLGTFELPLPTAYGFVPSGSIGPPSVCRSVSACLKKALFG